MMKPEDFVELVRTMRAGQSQYFRTRNASTLKAAKELEAQVDQAVKELQGLPL